MKYNTIEEYFQGYTEDNIIKVKNDFFKNILPRIKKVLPELKQKINEGMIQGDSGIIYRGKCGCLLATAHLLINGQYVDGNSAMRVYPESLKWNPYEHFIYHNVEKGDRPENNEFLAKTIEWIEEYEKQHNFE